MQEKWKHKSIKTLYKNVDSSITHNSQTLEKDQMPINKKINYDIFIQWNSTQGKKSGMYYIQAATWMSLFKNVLSERNQTQKYIL